MLALLLLNDTNVGDGDEEEEFRVSLRAMLEKLFPLLFLNLSHLIHSQLSLFLIC